MTTFITAARELQALLCDVGEDFVVRYLDLSAKISVQMLCHNDIRFEADISSISSAEQRNLIALSAILRRLLEAATRDRMTFLLPHISNDKEQLSSSRRIEQNILKSLPEAISLRFRQLLATYWDVLNEAGSKASFLLPSAQLMHWNVIKDGGGNRRILLRLQTSDGRTRKIHVPFKQYHELRHSVALILKDMNQVERHPIMRLTSNEQKRRTEAARINDVP
ncbi:hypothetical protein CCR75_008653 [Bremia lactucae]|uniref:COMM domain-containing protein 5 n=1 Tax=Bremia lactucae TaxID=4779 RepID=A0A976IB97_BRELC|nr:hypothetical protein CCR75_008653 [Bremia lactucae]